MRTEVLSAAIRQAPRSLTRLLGDAPAGCRALRLARVRHLLGRPACHQISWIVEPYASAIKGADFTETPLYTALADVGARVHRATERVRPALLPALVAARLQHPAGSPVFVSERATYDDQGALVVMDHATILGEWMEIRAEAQGHGPVAALGLPALIVHSRRLTASHTDGPAAAVPAVPGCSALPRGPLRAAAPGLLEDQPGAGRPRTPGMSWMRSSTTCRSTSLSGALTRARTS